MKKRNSHLILFLISLLIIGLDQFSKFVVSSNLVLGDTVPVYSNVFHLTLVHNQGVAFGLMDHLGSFLILIIAASVIALFVYLVRLKDQSLYFRVAYGFILGGALGNLIDRLRVGYVIDFLDFRIWPVFNIADTFISVGIGLIILKSFSKSHAS